MLTFTYPWLLWGLAGLALPVLAHMVHRHTTKRLSFPSLRFIRISQIPRKGRSWPTDLLLLLLRLLLLAAAIICVAGPRWLPQDAIPSVNGEETIVFIDNSSSMGGWGIPAEVSDSLLKVIQEEEGGLGAITFSDKTLPGEEGFAFLKGYDPTKTRQFKGNPQKAINEAISLFSPEGASQKLIIISDFQSSDWQLASAQLDSLGIALKLIPVGQKRGGNISILGVRTSPAADEKIRIWVQLANQTGEEQNLKGKLEAGSDEWIKEIALKPDQNGQAQFLLPRDEYFKAKASIGEDVYAPDNVYHFWLMAPPARKVEFFLTPNGDKIGEEEAFFLRTAIISATANEWQKYLVTHHSFKENEDAPDREAVFIPGFGKHLKKDDLSLILDHAMSGGKVVVTPGSSPAEMLSILRENKFLEADYRGLKESSGRGMQPYRLAGLPESNPLGRLFAGDAGKDLYLSQVHKFVALRPRGEIRTILSIEDGDPLLLQRPLGKGSLFLFTTRFHGTWSDLPLRNSFLPLVREILTGFGEQKDSKWPRISVGDTLTGNGTEDFKGNEPGLFQWNDQLVAVNTPHEESIPDVLDVELISESLGAVGSLSSKGTPISHEENKGTPLGPWFALLAMGLFLAESFWVRPRDRHSNED
jgi:hypothetical protein